MVEKPPSGTYHRRPGDRVVRVPVIKPEIVRIEKGRPPRPLPPPQLILGGGFLALILVGGALLMLPIATVPGETTTLTDALFTATSAVCVTGLVVEDTATHWTFFGQAVILLLIQLGGLGFMTFSTLIFILIGHRVTLRERLLLRESLGAASLNDVTRLGMRIAAFALPIEALGSLLLFIGFASELPLGSAIWRGVFHGVSAFNNAGFDLVGRYQSLVPYQRNPLILLTTAALIILGGISFSFMADAVRVRRFSRLTLDSKLVLISTAALLIVGTVLLLVAERDNVRTLATLTLPAQLLNAFFQSVVARTAGFNSVDMLGLRDSSLFLLIALMFIGAASGSTGGGIKVNTFSVLFLAVVSTIGGKPQPEVFGREVSQAQVLRALSVVLLAIALIFPAAFVLSMTERAGFLQLLFEVISAFGTVGLTAGVTPELTEPGRIVIMLMMYVGRLGPLTLALALNLSQRRTSYRFPVEAIKIG